MEQMKRSLQEFEEKVIELKKVHNNEYRKIKFDRTKDDVKKRKQKDKMDMDLWFDRAMLETKEENEMDALAIKIEKEYLAQLKKTLKDQRDQFAETIKKEHGLADDVLGNVEKEYEENLKSQQKIIDSLNERASSKLESLHKECLNLKGLIETMGVEETTVTLLNHGRAPAHDMISMPRWFFQMAVDNSCASHLAMQFKVLKLDELYPDLEKYDTRAHLRAFGIRGRSIKFHIFMGALRCHGHIQDSEVYYLQPAPCSEPPKDLVKIVGEDDVDQMVRAHAEYGTKVCLLYLVSRHEDQDPDECLPFGDETDEEADGAYKRNMLPNSAEGERQSGTDGHQSGAVDNL